MLPPQYPLSHLGWIIKEKAEKLGVVRSEDEAVTLAEHLGIVVQMFDFRSLQGMLMQSGEYPVLIGVNKNLSYVMRTKAISHEIGHYFLHCGNFVCPVFADSKTLFNRAEREADLFAWFLMSEGLRELLLEEIEGSGMTQ